jgi:hypothetical protein
MPDAMREGRRIPLRPVHLPGLGELTGFRRGAASRSRRSGRLGGSAVSGFERQRMLSALILLVIALFVAGAYPPAARWRGELRVAAVLGFCAALGWALIEIGLWLAAAPP